MMIDILPACSKCGKHCTFKIGGVCPECAMEIKKKFDGVSILRAKINDWRTRLMHFKLIGPDAAPGRDHNGDERGWKMTEQEAIAFWKANEKPFGLVPKEAQEWLEAFKGPIEALTAPKDGSRNLYWQEITKDAFREPIHWLDTYRLPADYQPKKAGRWVECEVFASGNGFAYYFRHKGECPPLYEAPGMVGFGGVRYGKLGWNRSLCHIIEDSNEVPVAPTHVRFWVEG